MAAPRTFRVGIWLGVIGYALWFVSALLSRVLPPVAHHAELFAPYISQWAVTLVYALTLVEILIALGPLARGERWSWLAALLPVIVVGIPRFYADPRCFASIFSEHGCHTFLASQVLVLIGLLLAAPSTFRRNPAPSNSN